MADSDERQSENWEEVRPGRPLDERTEGAYGRLMEAEQTLHTLWEEPGEETAGSERRWGSPLENDGVLYVSNLGEKVAVLGGHLELAAVFPDRTVTLVREPGPA